MCSIHLNSRQRGECKQLISGCKVNIVLKASTNNLHNKGMKMCCAENRGTNLGPRHIRQNWFTVTIINAMLQYTADFAVVLQGPFHHMALWKRPYDESYLGKKAEKTRGDKEECYQVIISQPIKIQTCSDSVSQYISVGEGNGWLTESRSVCATFSLIWLMSLPLTFPSYSNTKAGTTLHSPSLVPTQTINFMNHDSDTVT